MLCAAILIHFAHRHMMHGRVKEEDSNKKAEVELSGVVEKQDESAKKVDLEAPAVVEVAIKA